jgi:hypothetical protein
VLRDKVRRNVCGDRAHAGLALDLPARAPMATNRPPMLARLARAALGSLLIVCGWPTADPVRAAGEYPLTVSLAASASTAETQINSRVLIHVDRLMEESRRKRVTDALTYSGYGNFLNALRALPPIGAIALQARTVEIRYAREEQEPAARRLVLVADHPLFFLSGDLQKSRAGYELAVVELRIDAQGGVTGRMAGAARVKPSPDGVVLDDFADVPVQLSGQVETR